SSVGERYKYTGRELDADTGLQHNRAREYDPKAERWMQEDPAGFSAGDSNLKRYAKDGPTNATDPTGNVLLAAGDSRSYVEQNLSESGVSYSSVKLST